MKKVNEKNVGPKQRNNIASHKPEHRSREERDQNKNVEIISNHLKMLL